MDKHIRSFIKYISLERRYSKLTAESYTNDLRQFEDFLKEYLQSDIVFWHLADKKVIRYYLVYLQEQDLSRRSIARKLATIKSFFKYLSREEIIPRNPALSIKMPRYEKKLPEYISLKEMEAILKLPQLNDFEGIRDLTILELFYGTGMRLSELINLKMSQLLLKEDLIRIRGKGNKDRVVPIGSAAKKILERYLEFRPQYADNSVDNVLVLKSGKTMYPMAVQRIVKKYLSQLSHLNHKSPHLLRHTYATHLLNAGASIRVVKDLLGHESLSTTQVYTHMSIEHLKDVYKHAHPGASDNHHKT